MTEFENVMDLIHKISIEPSRLVKETLLRELTSLELGSKVVEHTYNPFITYGIKPIATVVRSSPNFEFTWPLVQGLLQKLASRALSGTAASREVFEVMSSLSPDSAHLLFLILSKDLKCGIGEATINIAVPGLIPTFSVMRAQKYEARKVKTWPWMIEPKLDGQRNTFLCKDGKGAFFTRSGKVVPALDFLVPKIMDIAMDAATRDATMCTLLTDHKDPEKSDSYSFMLDGEAMMGLFKSTGALRKKDTQATSVEFHLYDIMSYADFENKLNGQSLSLRRKWLTTFVRYAHDIRGKDGPIQIVPQYFANSHQEALDFYEKMLSKPLAKYLARGDAAREAELTPDLIDVVTGNPKTLEGAMLKDPGSFYEKRRSNNWLKLKAEETEDLPIVDIFPGEPHTKYENCMGGLIVDRAGVLVRVGGGFSDLERVSIWQAWHVNPDHMKGRLIEVKFHEVTPDGSLRHPRFMRFRDDKEGETDG